MAAVAKASLESSKATLAPLPTTIRGYGIHMDSTKKDDRLVYAAGTQIVVRSLADPSQSWLFDGHRVKVNCARFSPNGEWVASGDDKGRVLIWGTKNQIIKSEVQVTANRVLDIAWDADGKRLVAVGKGNDMHAKVFMWDSGSNLGQITGHAKAILSCDYRRVRPYRIATSSEDFIVQFYEGPPFKFHHSDNGHQGAYPNCVRYSPDGAHLCSVGSDKKIRIYDGKEGTHLKDFEAKDNHTGGIYSVSWSPDSKSIATASADKSVKIWDVESGACQKTITMGKDVGNFQVSVQWHATGAYLIAASLNGELSYIDPAAGTITQTIAGHQDGISSMSVCRATSQIFTCDSQGVVCVDGKSLKATRFGGKGHAKGVVAVAVSGDGSTVTSVGLDDKLKVSDSKSCEYGADSANLGGSPTGVCAGNKDAGLAIASVAQGKLVVTRGGKVTHSEAIDYRPESIALSMDDTTVAVGGDRKVYLYTVDGDTLKAGKVIEGAGGKVLALTFSADGRFLVATGSGREIYVYGVGAYDCLNPRGWKFHASKVGAVAVSPDGSKIASGSQDQNIFVWSDTKEFDNHRKEFISAHTDDVQGLAFLDGNTLVSYGADRAIRLWEC